VARAAPPPVRIVPWSPPPCWSPSRSQPHPSPLPQPRTEGAPPRRLHRGAGERAQLDGPRSCRPGMRWGIGRPRCAPPDRAVSRSSWARRRRRSWSHLR